MNYELCEQQVPEGQIKTILSVMGRAKNCLEIGSWMGNTSIPIAKECKKQGGFLICVDTWRGNVGTHLEPLASQYDILSMFLQKTRKETDNIIPIISDSTNAVFFKNNYFDFIFIDGAHTYNIVSQDIKNSWRALRKGGVLCGHDLESLEYDERYVEKDFVDGVHHGVTKAVTKKFKKVNRESSIWWVVK